MSEQPNEGQLETVSPEELEGLKVPVDRSAKARERWKKVSSEDRKKISQRRAVSTLISAWPGLDVDEKARVFRTVLGTGTDEIWFKDFMIFCDSEKDVFPVPE